MQRSLEPITTQNKFSQIQKESSTMSSQCLTSFYVEESVALHAGLQVTLKIL